MSWAAVRGSTPSTVRAALGLRTTGVRQEIPESEVSGAELPGGWYMIVSDHDRLELTSERVLARLSNLGETVACVVEEHTNTCYALSWRDARCIWWIWHEGHRDENNLETGGVLPPEFAAIRDQLIARLQESRGEEPPVDYIFDIPLETVYSLIGYRHDQDIPALGREPFEVLEATLSQEELGDPRPWWRRLLRG
jgi:hypothetical protein